ncbi:MAG: DUF559 domain-containing protein [Thermoplasmatota archaeon]|nr:endonuclease domain-containing protein [Candidatus Thermoplasmatota archaeon]MBU1913732.1 endonuclease domain-containing protein [Candidatus Thermoplasmatota archaeon]
MSRYSVGRSIAKQIIKEDKKRRTHGRILKEAEARPESIRVGTEAGEVAMSPIEYELYQAMRKEGLSPTPQFRIDWYTVDFAFPDVKLAIEADGIAYHSGDRRDHDRKRDWKLKTQFGWTVMRFYGTTIHNKAGNCAYVVKREVEARRKLEEDCERQKEKERQARNEAIARPFRKVVKLLKPNRKRRGF